MEHAITNLGEFIAKLFTAAVLLPATGTFVLFAYTWLARRRAAESR
jgi:hypothetical protein